jgi:hypothetical protein
MPRSTHPSSQEKHDRGRLREQRSRFIRRRWHRNKALYRIEEGTGAMVVNMNSKRVQKKCGDETMRELADVLGQEGPLLFLHPEVLRHAPKELRRKVERCLGLHVLGANEMTRSDSARDPHLTEAAAIRRTDRALDQRSKRERSWHTEVADSQETEDEEVEAAVQVI